MNKLNILILCIFWCFILIIVYIFLINKYNIKNTELFHIKIIQEETNNKNFLLERNLQDLQEKYKILLEEKNIINNKYQETQLTIGELNIKIHLQDKLFADYEKNINEQKEHFKNIANDTLNNQTDSFLKKMDFFLNHFQNKQEDTSKNLLSSNFNFY